MLFKLSLVGDLTETGPNPFVFNFIAKLSFFPFLFKAVCLCFLSWERFAFTFLRDIRQIQQHTTLKRRASLFFCYCSSWNKVYMSNLHVPGWMKWKVPFLWVPSGLGPCGSNKKNIRIKHSSNSNVFMLLFSLRKNNNKKKKKEEEEEEE